MNKSINNTVKAFALCAATLVAYTVTAGSATDLSVMNASRTYVVKFQDLDLSRVDGASALYARLRHAAGVVCEPLDSRQLGLAEKYHSCFNKAVADAVASVNRPLVSQVYQSHTGIKTGTVQLASAN